MSTITALRKGLTPKKIQEMLYTDFVALVNQWNVLPGSYVTLSQWSQYANINQNSRVLSVACTTGFTLRELATLTKCSGIGIDISEASAEMANINKATYAPDLNLEYFYQDAYHYKPTEKFTHIEVGAALKFFPDVEKITKKITSWLVDGGYLLVCPYYISKPVPQELVERAKEVFGITITTENYKDVMSVYKGFEIMYEDRKDIIQESEAEMHWYTESTIKRACEMHNIQDEALRNALYERLYAIKKMANDLRPYQAYTTLVLRYRKSIYPNRYVELF